MIFEKIFEKIFLKNSLQTLVSSPLVGNSPGQKIFFRVEQIRRRESWESGFSNCYRGKLFYSLPGVTSPGWAGLSPWSSCHNLCLGKNVKSVFAGTFKNLSRIDFAVKGRPGRSILRSQGNHWRKIHSTQWGIWEEAQCLHAILQISHAHLMCVHSPLMEVENENSANYTARNHHLNH